MKFLSLNCQSFNTAKKDIFSLGNKYNLDFLCLSETWEQESDKISFQSWQILTKPRKQDHHGGVAILNKHSEKFIVTRNIELERNDVVAICATIQTAK